MYCPNSMLTSHSSSFSTLSNPSSLRPPKIGLSWIFPKKSFTKLPILAKRARNHTYIRTRKNIDLLVPATISDYTERSSYLEAMDINDDPWSEWQMPLAYPTFANASFSITTRYGDRRFKLLCRSNGHQQRSLVLHSKKLKTSNMSHSTLLDFYSGIRKAVPKTKIICLQLSKKCWPRQ